MSHLVRCLLVMNSTPFVSRLIGLLLMCVSLCGVALAKDGPCDDEATESAKALYERFWSLRERGVMFGHQDALLYGHDWKYDGESDVKVVAGDYPAVFGWELGEIGLGKEESLDGVLFSKIREGIVWAHEKGGINTVSWHGVNVLTGGDSWDTSSKKVVASVLPGGEKEAEYRAVLERLAAFFLSVTDAEGQAVPFVFRPYHEHTGSWFWWGEKLCSEDEYTELWRYTVDFLRERGVHSMLLAYSSASGFRDEAHYLERYPGDGYVDLVGFDSYQSKWNHHAKYVKGVEKSFSIVAPFAEERGKLLIFAETGYESIPDEQWWTKTLWPLVDSYPVSYVLVWRNAHNQENHFYAPYPGQGSAEDFRAFKAMDRVLFLGDVTE